MDLSHESQHARPLVKRQTASLGAPETFPEGRKRPSKPPDLHIVTGVRVPTLQRQVGFPTGCGSPHVYSWLHTDL